MSVFAARSKSTKTIKATGWRIELWHAAVGGPLQALEKDAQVIHATQGSTASF